MGYRSSVTVAFGFGERNDFVAFVSEARLSDDRIAKDFFNDWEVMDVDGAIILKREWSWVRWDESNADYAPCYYLFGLAVKNDISYSYYRIGEELEDITHQSYDSTDGKVYLDDYIEVERSVEIPMTINYLSFEFDEYLKKEAKHECTNQTSEG